MKTDKPIRKAFILLLITIVLGNVIFFIAGIRDAYLLGQITGGLLLVSLIAALVAGLWGYFSQKAWPWWKIIVTYVVTFLIIYSVLLLRALPLLMT